MCLAIQITDIDCLLTLTLLHLWNTLRVRCMVTNVDLIYLSLQVKMHIINNALWISVNHVTYIADRPNEKVTTHY